MERQQMIRFENQVLVAEPVEQVFAFVSDFRNIPKWNYYVQSVDQTSAGEPGVGTTYHQVRKTDEQRFRITDYRPPEAVTVKTEPGSRPAFEMRFTFESVDGGTLITDAWELETGRPGLLEKLAAGQIMRAVMGNLTKLKTLLETGRVQLQDGRGVER
jgi:uncharacterized protein YndB with AHSA1/START domain